MKAEVVARLQAINHDFYERLAEPFAASRSRPWPGFAELANYLPDPCPRLLDAGCGSGRLGRYLLQHDRITHYVGVDASAPLLDAARRQTAGDFWQRDLLDSDPFANLGDFDAVTCIATLHHIPGEQNRLRLLKAMQRRLLPGGRLLISTFQFLDSPRLRRRLIPWHNIGFAAQDVEPDDYLLDWRRDGYALRYMALLDEPAVDRLAVAAELTVVSRFYSDGHNNRQNLYVVLR